MGTVYLRGKTYWIQYYRNGKQYNESSKSKLKMVASNLLGYGTYKKWVHLRQTCLAHLIRKAKALSESKDKASQHFGKKILKELQLLCHWAKAPPDEDQWYEFYQRCIDLVFDHHQQKNEVGHWPVH